MSHIQTAEDYRLEFQGVKLRLDIISKKISNRVIELCKKYPDVSLSQCHQNTEDNKTLNSNDYDFIFSNKTIIVNQYPNLILNGLITIENQIRIIKAIEDTEFNNKSTQLKLEIPEV